MERSWVEDTQVPGGDLTLTEGAPTAKADPVFVLERVPDGGASSGASYGFAIVVAVGLVGLVITVSVGRWVNTSAMVTLACSVLVFTLILVAGLLVPCLRLARRS